MHAVVQCGPSVDGYLNAEGAIAQAVDRDTILLHSSVFGMSASDQIILVLHELAHLEQLAKSGDDPVGALEDEAWEAAHAWRAGRPYRIRGRARRPLNALAIIQGGADGHPAAPPWYESNPIEPIGNKSHITVKGVKTIEDMTFESVLDTIIQEKPTEIVLVCHSLEGGLQLPLMAGAKSGASPEQIFPLSADGSHDDGGPIKAPVRSVKDVATLAQLTEQQITTLRFKMNQIRSLNLKHVAFRACTLGTHPDSLEAFRKFFGAKSVSAPTLFDMYGQFKPSMGRNVTAWVKNKRDQGFHASMDLEVGFGTKRARRANAFEIVCQAPDKNRFAAWVRAHIADRPGLDNLVVYHGMLNLGATSPDSPIVYFVRDRDFISNIVYYDGSSQ
jgi:hypothetical protein